MDELVYIALLAVMMTATLLSFLACLYQCRKRRVAVKHPLYPHVVVTPRFHETDTFSLVSTSFCPMTPVPRPVPLSAFPRPLEDASPNTSFVSLAASQYFPIFKPLKHQRRSGECSVPSEMSFRSDAMSAHKAGSTFPTPYATPLVRPYLVVPVPVRKL
nr:uncharacterized protein LOC113812766 [Penaeus vannamei]